MKKNIIFVIFLVFTLSALLSCSTKNDNSLEQPAISFITPSGEITNKSIELKDDFNNIVILGKFNVILEEGSGSLDIETSSNIQEYINYSLFNKTLTISTSDLVSFNTLVKITIKKDNINDIKMSYGSLFQSNLNFDQLKVSLDTISSITLSGEINFLTINMTDMSTAVIDNSKIKEAVIDVSVNSNLYINLNGTITGNVSDLSKVSVTGNISSNSISSDSSSKVNLGGNLKS